MLAVRAVRAGSASLRDETMKQSFLEVDGGQCQRNTDQCLKVAVLLRQEQRQEQAKEGWLGTADGRGLISLHFRLAEVWPRGGHSLLLRKRGEP